MYPNFFITTLAQSLAQGGSETEIFVSSITTLDGQTVTTSDFTNFGRGILTIDPQSTQRTENVSFTGVDGAGIGFTGAIRGLSFKDNTVIATNKKFHPVGAPVLISFGTHNILDMIASFAPLASPNFTGHVTVPTPTLGTDAATKAYVDGVTTSGAPNANTTTKGIVQEATQTQVDNGITSGSTGADLFIRPDTLRSKLTSDYVVDTGTANTYAIAPTPAITAYTAGQVFIWKVNNTNTGVSTLNVSGLGTKTIKKVNGTTDLASGDLVAGQVVRTVYDGTNFQLISPVGNAPLTASNIKFGGTGADGTLSISSGTTTIDCAGASVVVKNYTSISITGTAKLAFINPGPNGTVVFLLSQGNVTLTSSTVPMIDMSGMGAPGGNGVTGSNGGAAYTSAGNNGTNGFTGGYAAPQGGLQGTSTVQPNVLMLSSPLSVVSPYFLKYPLAGTGAGGGSGAISIGTGGSATSGNAGRGGGGLIIECGGVCTFTTTNGISVAGTNASTGTSSGAGSSIACGSGGGAAGFFSMLYAIAGTITGTVNVSGGNGSTVVGGGGTSAFGGGGGCGIGGIGLSSSTTSGTNGGAGIAIIAQNNQFM